MKQNHWKNGKIKVGIEGDVMKFMLAGFLGLFGMILLGLSFESFGEVGNMLLKFIAIISVVASVRIAMNKKSMRK
ncbi:hypothetical protein [Pseudalkalibacillus sp. NRS-1564]|uniref:hypothetical protein n=1 Tax=Pseudalkalibacillus sp. NRS-1564 TaxID=3233900 RepID=UPI003D2761CC